MNTFIQDLKYGARMFFKYPGITIIAIITLALGIGANSAIFNVVNDVLLNPLPYNESDRLVMLSEHNKSFGEMSIAYPNFEDWRSQNRVFEKMGVYRRDSYNLTGTGEPEQIRVAQMSAELFETLRVKAALGHVYTNAEDKPGANPVVVLGHQIWRRRFGSDASIIGRAITLDNRQYTVIGIMPEGYQYPTRVEMWTPIATLSIQETWKIRGNHPGISGLARLKPGVTLEQAREDMKRVTSNLEKLYPDSNKGNSATITPMLEGYVRNVRHTLYVLFGAVGFLLLIACANVANLTLARASGRQKELALRTALGATRGRIVRQLLTESLLLAFIGGGLGVVIANYGVKTIVANSPMRVIPRAAEIGMDSSVLLFTLLISVVSSVGFGLAPALQLSRPDVQETLKASGKGNSGGHHRLRNIMIVTEVALTMILLIGAGLMVRSFYHLQQVNPGFNTSSVLSFTISLPEEKYPDTDLNKRIQFYDRVKNNIETVPGVQTVGLSRGLPLGRNGWQTSFSIVGRPEFLKGQEPSIEANVVDIDYIKTMGIPLLRGRWFNEQDNRSHIKQEDLAGKTLNNQVSAGLKSIVIDELFKNRYWLNEDPIGKQIKVQGETVTVIGVVGRVNMEGVRTNTDRVQGYFAYRQLPFLTMTYTVKSSIIPEQLTASIRRQIYSVDPDQPISDVSTLEDIRAESVGSDRFTVILLGVFAAISLILALIGIYGIISWSITQRIREIGIRVALGALSKDVLQLVIGQGMKLVAIGIIIGLTGALLLTRLMSTMLFGVKATDPVTFIIIAGLFIITSLLACLIPARRAVKVDPIVVLRYE